MTAAKDRSTSPVHVTPLSREEAAATLQEWARTYPPSRFVVYGVADDPDYGGYDGDVIAWGLGFDDHVYVQTVDCQIGGRFSSADSMRRIMFRRERDIRLLWIDPEPET
jgi:hypothetical protein